jgi:hypothetical protein
MSADEEYNTDNDLHSIHTTNSNLIAQWHIRNVIDPRLRVFDSLLMFEIRTIPEF